MEQLSAFYNTTHTIARGQGMATLAFGNELRKIIDRIIGQLSTGEIKAGDVDKDLWQLVAGRLEQGMKEGLAKSTDIALRDQLRKNIFVFSGFKNYQFLRDASSLLLDPVTNAPKPFAQFREEILQLNDQYNVNFLRTEYNHAVGGSQQAAQWARVQRDKKALPLLQYLTAGDARVRISHQPLDLIIRPADDPFWDVFMPPNDWNCRCTVRQLADGEVTQIKHDELPQLKPMFQTNIGKSGFLFPPSHPYFSVAPEHKGLADNNFGLPI